METLDLNLARGFIALYEEGSVTCAAERLGVSQPSMSHALGRLRTLLDDPLFVRHRSGIRPTRTAESLYPDFAEAITGIEDAIAQQRDFSPRHSRRRFRLALSDIGELMLLPAVAESLHVQAPGIGLDIVPLEAEHAEDWLENDFVDALICSRQLTRPCIQRRRVFAERYVGVCDANHPRLRHLDTLEAFLDESHIVVDRAAGHGLADDVLAGLGLDRRASLRVPHFFSLPHLIEHSELVSIVPVLIARTFARQAHMRWFELPFDVPGFEISLYRHRRARRSPADRWLWQAIADALAHFNPLNLA